MSQPRWAVVVPVKRLTAAKSRLRGALPGVPHEELALALAADTLRAVLACPTVAEVLVVTDDDRVAAATRAAGARVVPDEPDAGLNAAFRHGATSVPTGWVAGLTADLPALRPAELASALLAAQTGRAGVRRFVPDAPGGGTV
uniref:NTP transferase domain-containing protein n=1 Tax=Micromonospora acroterricola TaxID=2202421 RepID=UPI001F44F388